MNTEDTFALDGQIRGLSELEVWQRIEAGQVNTPVDPETVTLRDIIRSNVCTYFNLIFLIMAVFLIAVRSYRNLTFLPLIMLNTGIGIFQQWRSRRALDKIRIMHAPKTWVMRAGKKQEIDSAAIVRGDVLVLRAGNQIPADARILQGEVSVNESLLTGESDEIIRHSGDSLLSGSFIVSGECYAQAEKVGADSYISELTLKAKAHKGGEASEMIRSLDRLVKMIGIVIVPVAAGLLYQHYLVNHNTLAESVTSTVAAVIGMIPEGLYLLASVAMAVSAMRLAMDKVLVHDMKSIETLARVDVLCVDKTGTITENEMHVMGIAVLEGGSQAPENGAVVPGSAQDAEELLRRRLGDFASVMREDNETMKALKAYFVGAVNASAQKVLPFSSVYKYSGAQIDGISYVLGASELVLREDYVHYEAQILSFIEEGYRVLLFGMLDGELESGPIDGHVTPLGIVLLSNPVRPQAQETFQYFAQQGVQIKVISGDSPLTASRAAAQAHIPGAERCIDVSTLTDEELPQAAQTYTVFGRVSPACKQQLIRAMKAQGHTVAMTGDGVNDVLAMREADCSVAMAAGAQAAAQSAQMVLLESDFSKMPAVVSEGRRVVNNIERSASLFLIKNIFSFLMALFSLLFQMNYPIEPVQLSLVSTVTIGTPAFFLSLETNQKRISGHFLTNILYRAAPAGITDFILVSTLVLFSETFGMEEAQLSACAVMVLAFVGFLVLLQIMRPITLYHALLWLSMAVFFWLCAWGVPILTKLYGITALTKENVLILLLLVFAGASVLRCLNELVLWCRQACGAAHSIGKRLLEAVRRHIG